jgi:hypothetical protein
MVAIPSLTTSSDRRPSPIIVEDAPVLQLLNCYALRFTFLRSLPHITFSLSIIAQKLPAARIMATSSLQECGIVIYAGKILVKTLEATRAQDSVLLENTSGPPALPSSRPSMVAGGGGQQADMTRNAVTLSSYHLQQYFVSLF